MKILIVSPHPDDETLGAAGLILKHKDQGDKVFWLNITDVDSEHGWDKDFIEKRKKQIKDIKNYYCFDGFFNLALPPAELGEIKQSKIISAVSDVINAVTPDWVVLPNPGDAHTDHRVVFESCMACTKSFRYPFIKKILTMEILSETDFSKTGEPFAPNYFVDISSYIDKKIKALQIYDTELKEAPFPRNVDAVKALALLRGGMAGCMYAESFRIIKEMD